jgi:tetratricopeptide (TPR) repeat protein
MLAHHYRSAIDLMSAARTELPSDVIAHARAAFAGAGDRALALNAHNAAAQFFEQALDLVAETAEERARLEYRLALALFGMGDDRRAEALERARASLLDVGDCDHAAELDSLLAEVWWLQGRVDRCLEFLRRAEGLIADASATPEKARVLAQICRFQMLGDHNEEALRTAAKALALAERLGLDELRINVLVTIGTAKANSGDVTGIDDLEHAVELTEGRVSPAAWRAYNNLAVVVTHSLGDIRRSRELHEQGLGAAERYGDRVQILWFRGQFVYDAYWLGDFDGALRDADAVIAEAEGGSPHNEEAGSRVHRARIRLARDDEAGAIADAERAIQLARTAEPQQLRGTLANAAFVLLAEGGFRSR